MSNRSQDTLIVLDDDNDESTRGIEASTLRQAGYRIVECTNQRRLFDVVRKEMPALIVIARDNSNAARIELCRQLKADSTTARIMILEILPAGATAERNAEGQSAADAYMIEPFEAQAFLATTNMLLRLYDREAENRRLRDELRATRVDEALRRGRESLSLAFSAGQMGVYDYDIAHDRLWCSPEIYSVFGVASGSFTPTMAGLIALVHPEDRPAFSEHFNEGIVNHRPFNFEFRINGPTGELRWIANRAQTEYDANGRAMRHLGVALDITQRKRAEEIAQRWQQLFEQSYFGLAHEDARTNSFVAVNRAFAEHRGYSVDELVGQPSSMIFPAELQESVGQTIRDADEVGHVLFETLNQCKNHKTFPVLLEVTTIKDAAGRPQSRMAYAIDISRLKSAEAALRESEEQFRGFFESAAVGTALSDPETGHFRRVNETFCRMVGYSAEELAVMTPYELTYPADRAYHLEVAGRWHSGETQSFQIEKRFLRKDGSPLWVRVNADRVRDSAGRPVMGVGIISDISERKRIQFNAEFLLDLGRELGRLTDADEIGNTAVRAMAQYLGVPACALMFIDLPSGTAEFNYRWSSDQRSFAPSYPIADFVCEELQDSLRRGEPLAINDVDVDPRTRPFRTNFAAQNTRSFAAAPLLSEGVFEAILAVAEPAPRVWMSNEVRCLQNVIARVWPAIKRARAIAALRAGEATLRARNHDLARFNRAAVGRELRMIELKREINEMCGQLGQPPRYALDFDNQA